jgi:DNA-binding MarR family transcriptional regulator
MDVADQVFAIQRAYPQVYFACHTRHEPRRTSAARLSPSDGNVLVHLDAHVGVHGGTRPGELAAHLGLAPSSLSATIGRLEQLGYVARAPSSRDRRAAELRLTTAGIAAIQASSVLDAARLGAVLGKLGPRERAAAVAGLELLARGAHALLAEQGSATQWARARRRATRAKART